MGRTIKLTTKDGRILAIGKLAAQVSADDLRTAIGSGEISVEVPDMSQGPAAMVRRPPRRPR